MTARSTHTLALLAFLAAPALAQTTAPAERIPAAAQMRHAGTYHLATGTWTRHTAATAAFGSTDVVYCNTAPTGYFTAVTANNPGSTAIDEGGLPGTTNGQPFPVAPNRDSYLVSSFQISYCDLGQTPSSASFDITFYSSYVPCTADMTPDTVVQLAGLPAGGCWTLDIDVSGGMEFCLGADGGEADPGWSDDVRRDSFGWGHSYTGSATLAGFILAGDPAVTDPGWTPGSVPTAGNGTYFGGNSGAGNTGYLNQDQFAISGSPGLPDGCYDFGPNPPYAGFHMEIRAETLACDVDQAGVGSVYCQSTANSSGDVARTRILGSDLAGEDAVRLVADQLPLNSMGYFITSQTQGFTPNPGGYMGNLCLAGDLGRFAGPNQIKNSGTDGEIALLTSAGEWSVGAIPSAGGGYAAIAGVTTNVQAWFRDMNPAGGVTSNFSDGASVVWR